MQNQVLRAPREFSHEVNGKRRLEDPRERPLVGTCICIGLSNLVPGTTLIVSERMVERWIPNSHLQPLRTCHRATLVNLPIGFIMELLGKYQHAINPMEPRIPFWPSPNVIQLRAGLLGFVNRARGRLSEMLGLSRGPCSPG